MGTPMAINLARAGHQLHVTTLVRLLMNYCHWVPLVLKLRPGNGCIGHHFYYGAGYTTG